MKLRWTAPALRDIAEIHSYVAENNPIAAAKLARLLRAQAEGLRIHPQTGRVGRVGGTRELILPGSAFIIAYRVTETSVDILAIRHSARLWPEHLD